MTDDSDTRFIDGETLASLSVVVRGPRTALGLLGLKRKLNIRSWIGFAAPSC